MGRIEREKLTVGQMIGIYCARHHDRRDGETLCDECRELLAYTHRRLELCPKYDAKSSCRKCEIHCYTPAKREKIREVMRYVGPRMIFSHPFSALRHLISELR